MKIHYRNQTFIALVFSVLCTANEPKKEYRPGGNEFSGIWKIFYAGDHEPELDDPLIAAGKKMTPFICEAVKYPDMKYRRYAIGALGHIGDKRAIPTLINILKSKNELDYFRGDALQSLFIIDRQTGREYSTKFGNDNDYLEMIKKSIANNEKWLTEPTNE
jgi:hypothetical protein